MKYTNSNKKNQKGKSRVFADERKLQLAKDITRLRRYSADEIADIFGTSRQIINYHMRAEEQQKKEASK